MQLNVVVMVKKEKKKCFEKRKGFFNLSCVILFKFIRMYEICLKKMFKNKIIKTQALVH